MAVTTKRYPDPWLFYSATNRVIKSFILIYAVSVWKMMNNEAPVATYTQADKQEILDEIEIFVENVQSVRYNFRKDQIRTYQRIMGRSSLIKGSYTDIPSRDTIRNRVIAFMYILAAVILGGAYLILFMYSVPPLTVYIIILAALAFLAVLSVVIDMIIYNLMSITYILLIYPLAFCVSIIIAAVGTVKVAHKEIRYIISEFSKAVLFTTILSLFERRLL